MDGNSNNPVDVPVQPEILDASGAPIVPDMTNGDEDGTEDVVGAPESESVTQPTKLIRVASMVRALLEEARRAPLDEAGRRLLREIHERSLRELQGILSDDLRQELADVALPFTSETPSESELLIAQAQLVGWLEGLFHGIQATLFTQQMAAQRQFEEMRGHRMLEPGGDPREMRGAPGAYL